MEPFEFLTLLFCLCVGELFPPIFPSKEGPDEAEDDGVEDQDDQREDQEMGEAKVEADEEDPAEEDAPTDTVKRRKQVGGGWRGCGESSSGTFDAEETF